MCLKGISKVKRLALPLLTQSLILTSYFVTLFLKAKKEEIL